MSNLYGRSVLLPDGNVEKGLRKLKKKLQAANLMNELRDRETYVKPTTRRKIKKSAAKNRWRRYVESQRLPPRMY
jgi:small subunit ribosomal protein S21